jgi:hypothetical protein
MSPRARFGLVAVLMVIAATFFGYRSFQTELESIRKRQQPGASLCNETVARARIMLRNAQSIAAEDPCRAELVQAEAIETIDGARKLCARYYAKAPMTTSNAAVERMESLRRDLHKACAEAQPAGGASESPSVK